jgi:hypothetical protein
MSTFIAGVVCFKYIRILPIFKKSQKNIPSSYFWSSIIFVCAIFAHSISCSNLFLKLVQNLIFHFNFSVVTLMPKLSILFDFSSFTQFYNFSSLHDGQTDFIFSYFWKHLAFFFKETSSWWDVFSTPFTYSVSRP